MQGPPVTTQRSLWWRFGWNVSWIILLIDKNAHLSERARSKSEERVLNLKSMSISLKDRLGYILEYLKMWFWRE